MTEIVSKPIIECLLPQLIVQLIMVGDVSNIKIMASFVALVDVIAVADTLLLEVKLIIVSDLLLDWCYSLM